MKGITYTAKLHHCGDIGIISLFPGSPTMVTRFSGEKVSLVTLHILKYLSVEGIDVIAQGCLLTVGYSNFIRSVDFVYWGWTVLKYGFLCSMLPLGRVVSAYMRKHRIGSGGVSASVNMEVSLATEKQQVNSLGIMSFCFILLGLTNRYSLMILCYFGIGYAGGTLAGCTPTSHLGDDFDMHHSPQRANIFQGIGGGINDGMRHSAAPSKGVYLRPASAELTRRAIACFMFSSVLSGYLFHDDLSELKPSLLLFGTMGGLCVAVATLRVSENPYICHRRDNTFGRIVTGLTPLVSVLLSVIGVTTARQGEHEEEGEEESLLGAAASRTPRGSTSNRTGKELPSAFERLTGGEGDDVEPFQGALPDTFMLMCKGNEQKARKAYARTLMWREENRIDEILSVPQPTFYQILELYPHAIHGKTRDGCVVVYEKLGMAKPIQLREQGISPENLVEHFVLRNEFVLQRCGASTHENREVDNLPRTRIVSILDVKGIAVADITTDVLAFLRISGQVVDNHYPGLVAKLIVCNAPSWFWTVWGMIARVLPESTRESIQIIGDTSALDQYIDKAMRPEEYGGTDVPLGQRTEFTSFVELGQGWENEGYVLYETLAEARKAKKREREEVAAAFQASRVSGVEAAQQKTWDSDSDESSEWEVVDGLTDDDDVGRGYHEHHAVSKDSSQSQSIYGWIRNGFKRPEQRHAYLGEKNCFRYDEERGEWRMSHPLPYSTPKRERRESRSASMESAGSPSGGHFPSGIGTFSAQKGGMRAEQRMKEQLEEHGLVLAIQAAHLANTGSVDKAGTKELTAAVEGARAQLSLSLERGQPRQVDEALSSGGSGSYTMVGGGRSSWESRMILLMLTYSFFVSATILAGLPPLLPVVMLTTCKGGGFGLHPVEVGMCLSVAAVFALQYHIFLRWRARRLAQLSPARSVRFAAAVGCAALIALSVLASLRVASVTSLPNKEVQHGFITDADRVIVPGFIIAIAACAVHHLRQALSCLLQVALDQDMREISVFAIRGAIPSNLVQLVGSTADVVGPVLCAVVMAKAHNYDQPADTSASAVVPVAACCILSTYISSFWLSLRFYTAFGAVETNLELSATTGGGLGGQSKDE